MVASLENTHVLFICTFQVTLTYIFFVSWRHSGSTFVLYKWRPYLVSFLGCVSRNPYTLQLMATLRKYILICRSKITLASLRKYVCTFWVMPRIWWWSPGELKITRRCFQIYRKSFENRPLGPPCAPYWSHFGASWEASWGHAPKRLDFRGSRDGPGSPTLPTWLQLGGPRPSKIDAKTRKTRYKRITRFWHRFFHRLDLILEGFLNDFLKEKHMSFVKTCI